MRVPTRWSVPAMATALALALLAAHAPSALAQGAPAAQKSPKKAPAAKAEALPPIFDPEIVGTKAVEAAVATAVETERRIFVILGTNDCKACRTFNDVLHETAVFADFIQQFVPVMIDVSPGGPNTDFLKNYAIDTKKGFPAVAIFESPDVLPVITRKGEMVAVVKKGPDAIRKWLASQYQVRSEVTVTK